MKAEIFNVLATVLWAVVAKYYSSSIWIYSWAFYPTLFLLSEIFIKYKAKNWLVVLLSFILLCISDYFFRVFRLENSGNNDEVGRGWRALVFLMTLITTTIALSINTYIRIKRDTIGVDMIGKSIFTNVIYIVAIATITWFVYMLILEIIE